MERRVEGEVERQRTSAAGVRAGTGSSGRAAARVSAKRDTVPALPHVDPHHLPEAAPGPRRAGRGLLFVVALVLLTLPVLPASLAAQMDGSSSIVGTVWADGLGEPLSGARIVVRGENREAVTTELGYFRFDGLEPGAYLLEVEYIGYTADPIRVETVRGGETPVSVSLRLDPRVLPGIVVEARAARPRGKFLGFYQRREEQIGIFLSQSEIEERTGSRGRDLFRGLPGVRVACNPRNPNHCVLEVARTPGSLNQPCPVEFYLDGVRMGPLRGGLDDIVTDDIAAIEIYRGPAEVPAEFFSTQGSNCGVVVLWTPY